MPFLQDVVRIDGLAGSLAKSFLADSAFTPKIVYHVGIPALVDWLGHVFMITLYTMLHNIATPTLKSFVENSVKDRRKRFRLLRQMEAWEYGSGSDYKFD